MPNSDSVQAIQIADDTIDGGEIIDNSLEQQRYRQQGYRQRRTRPGTASTGSKCRRTTPSPSRICSAPTRAASSTSACAQTAAATLNIGVSGAAVGETVMMSYTGSVALPSGVMFGPFRVVSANNITARACNVTTGPVSVSGLGVRFVTFG